MSASQAFLALTIAALVASPPPVPHRGFVGAPPNTTPPTPAHVEYEPDPLDGPPPPRRGLRPATPRDAKHLRAADRVALAKAEQKRRRKAIARLGGRR